MMRTNNIVSYEQLGPGLVLIVLSLQFETGFTSIYWLIIDIAVFCLSFSTNLRGLKFLSFSCLTLKFMKLPVYN